MTNRAQEFESRLKLEGGQWSPDAGLPQTCPSHFQLPGNGPPQLATQHNGKHLPDVCFAKEGPHRVYVISDWGGVLLDGKPKPADQRPKKDFVSGIDDKAQLLVAEQMRQRAAKRSPDYIINGGDSFYWGGLDMPCGTPGKIIYSPQLHFNFENVYTGAGLDGKPWLSVLGNHDYGGYQFNKGWDQLISYSWKPGGRWIMPGQYWRQTIRYPGFSVDYLFVDTNVFDSMDVTINDSHNICGMHHNHKNATCGKQGPETLWKCPDWFNDLWLAEQKWLEVHLRESKADWQVVVTHFPPTWFQDGWISLAHRYGIDLLISGHRHHQQVFSKWPENPLYPTPWLISGGGGGITSEAPPSKDGNDDEYGFYELTLTQDTIQIVGISHSGKIRSTTFVNQRFPLPADAR